MKRIKRALLLAVCVASTVPLHAAHAASAPIVIEFVKDCPAFTCWETAASPVEVDTVVTGGRLSGSVFHYTATETLSSATGSVTVDLEGILILHRDPNLTVLRGIVTDGAWNGVQLVGATVYAEAVRLEGTTFGGFLRILPATAG